MGGFEFEFAYVCTNDDLQEETEEEIESMMG